MRVPGVADSSGYDSSITLPDSFQQLSRLMQFPEEVALLLTDVEHRLFSGVSPVDYVRLVTADLTKQPLVLPTTNAAAAAKPRPTVSDLILRFQQVCRPRVKALSYCRVSFESHCRKSKVTWLPCVHFARDPEVYFRKYI